MILLPAGFIIFVFLPAMQVKIAFVDASANRFCGRKVCVHNRKHLRSPDYESDGRCSLVKVNCQINNFFLSGTQVKIAVGDAGENKFSGRKVCVHNRKHLRLPDYESDGRCSLVKVNYQFNNFFLSGTQTLRPLYKNKNFVGIQPGLITLGGEEIYLCQLKNEIDTCSQL